MADIIKVSPEKLKTSASSLEATGHDIAKTTQDMINLVTGISGNVWSGQASAAFINKFKGLQSDITKMNARLKQQSQHLNKIAGDYSSAESSNIAASTPLQTDFF